MPKDHPGRPPLTGTITSYSRRQGEYSFDIVISQVAPPAIAGHSCARIVNLVRRTYGEVVSVNAGLQDQYGTTPDDVVSKIDASVAAWVNDPARAT